MTIDGPLVCERSVPDPNYPTYFQAEGGLTRARGLRMPLQGNFLKVLGIKPGFTTLTEDAGIDPVK
jgi:hypothetical protein